MNNLSELQTELQKLSEALTVLSRQVEDLKPRNTDSDAIDFPAIEELARRSPICNPHLAKADEYTQDRYVRLLSTAAFLENEGRIEKLLYLCRLIAGSGCQQTAAELEPVFNYLPSA